ncbi:hypothetical protein [Dickeya fangzhongdai]|uniref:hypothetical protein n=1 Tax=Dickeya fangzhongdai TaxID=1778540 RepID=UPI0026E10F06|nr:hypothetical protein [Dickeya fangzhongdai]WKV51713.1 hypothetical protein PL145_05605 [Dickeya fangzhongdai]
MAPEEITGKENLAAMNTADSSVIYAAGLLTGLNLHEVARHYVTELKTHGLLAPINAVKDKDLNEIVSD